jgi:hypothetical protein
MYEGMAVSGDGRWLYAAGRSTAPDGGGALRGWLVRFERMPGGGLSVAQVVDCGPCVGDTIVLSPAGWLYSGAAGPVAMRWDPNSGVIGEAGRGFAISSSGNEPGGAGMAVGPDGTLYAADIWGPRIYQLRPVSDGFETARTYAEHQDGARGIQHLRSLALAPDGAHVYAAAGINSVTSPGTVATFARDPASGDLRFTSLFTGAMTSPLLQVTIDGGREYTADRNVVVTVTGGMPWNPGIEIAGDGGFAHAAWFAGSASRYDWALATSGADLLPETVYVRHGWNGWASDFAQDTIVLDERAPVVVSARRLARNGRRIRVRARDRISGVDRIQVARKRRRPGRWRPYSASRRYRVRRGALYLRARDRAGNRSRWHRVPPAPRRLTRQSIG